jgi:hypothetical protein
MVQVSGHVRVQFLALETHAYVRPAEVTARYGVGSLDDQVLVKNGADLNSESPVNLNPFDLLGLAGCLSGVSLLILALTWYADGLSGTTGTVLAVVGALVLVLGFLSYVVVSPRMKGK